MRVFLKKNQLILFFSHLKTMLFKNAFNSSLLKKTHLKHLHYAINIFFLFFPGGSTFGSTPAAAISGGGFGTPSSAGSVFGGTPNAGQAPNNSAFGSPASASPPGGASSFSSWR
jgi:hypothetical protein